MAGPAKKAEESEDLTQIVSGAESHEEEEGDDGHASFTESDGEDDDGDADATHFQSLLAKARQRGTRKSLDTSVQCIVAGGGGRGGKPCHSQHSRGCKYSWHTSISSTGGWAGKPNPEVDGRGHQHEGGTSELQAASLHRGCSEQNIKSYG